MDSMTNWVEIRDGRGRLIMKYDIVHNIIEMKKGGDAYILIKLDEIRQKHGIVLPLLAGIGQLPIEVVK